MRTFYGALLLSLVACATESTPPTISLPDRGVRPVYSVPGGGSAAALVFGEGSSFQFTGPTAPGTATFSAAPFIDFDDEPTSVGGGSVSITIGGQLYAAANLQSLATAILDDSDSYLAIQGYAESPGAGGTTHLDAALVIVPLGDYTPGATVALDGQERLVLFAAGNPEAEAPDVYGAAVTGTVQFGAGSATIGGTITATVDGAFGPIEILETEPPINGGTITAGTYALAVAPAVDVYCEGSLAGQEAAFANLTAASLGFVGGTVVVDTAAGVSISGAPISSALGASSIVLDAIDEGVVAAFVSQTGSGPAGSTLAGKYLVLDGTTASTTFVNAGLGAVYDAGDGVCQVGFGARLTSP